MGTHIARWDLLTYLSPLMFGLSSYPSFNDGQDIGGQCAPIPGSPIQVIDFQWNDPYAYTGQSIGQLLLHQKGQLPSINSSITYHFQTVADNTLIRIEAGPAQAGSPIVTVAVFDTQGKLLVSMPSYQTPTELTLQATGSYSVIVTANDTSSGEFYININQVTVTPAG